MSRTNHEPSTNQPRQREADASQGRWASFDGDADRVPCWDGHFFVAMRYGGLMMVSYD